MSGQIITGRRSLPPPRRRYHAPVTSLSRRFDRREWRDVPALRPTTYADRATVVALSEHEPAHAAPDGDAAREDAPRTTASGDSTPRHDARTGAAVVAATPVSTAGERASLALMAVALASFVLLVLALVVPSSLRLPLAGVGFVGLVVARVFGALVGWPERGRFGSLTPRASG